MQGKLEPPTCLADVWKAFHGAGMHCACSQRTWPRWAACTGALFWRMRAVGPRKRMCSQSPRERCALCRFDDYLAQAVTAYTGTRILAHAGGLPKEKEDKQAMATLFEVRALMVQPGGCAGHACSTSAQCNLCTLSSARYQACHSQLTCAQVA